MGKWDCNAICPFAFVEQRQQQRHCQCGEVEIFKDYNWHFFPEVQCQVWWLNSP